jgi:hypothetical protein
MRTIFWLLITLAGAAAWVLPCGAMPAEKRAMIPYSGQHAIKQHDFEKGYRAGRVQNLSFTEDGLMPAAGQPVAGLAGEYLSDEILLLFEARQLVLTWNADMPQGAWLHVQFRVRGQEADWSGWYDMSEWRRPDQGARNTRDETYGKLKVDILDAAHDFSTVQYRVRFYTVAGGAAPTLRMVTLCYSRDMKDEERRIPVTAPAGAADALLNVPWLSQLRIEDVGDEAMIEAGVCAPTSTAMVMQYHGRPVSVGQVAAHAFDPVSELYGNWAYLAATAGDFGLRSWVQRFNNWDDVRRLVEQGAPVIISIAYPKGTFKADPEKTSDGHLMVVRGFTARGNVIVNDPGTAFPERGRAIEYKWDEMGQAFFGHGGVGIIVAK